ncbi:uncharacterized protein LOC143493152 isoform X2 [Brachyhypopomus gauderio]
MPDYVDPDLSGCSTPLSYHSDDQDDLPTQTSQTCNTLMAALNKEIDSTEVISKAELERIISSELKQSLEKVLSNACRNLHALEHPIPGVSCLDGPSEDADRAVQLTVPSVKTLLLKLGFSQNLDEVQSYLISADRACLLSELDTARADLAYLQCKLENTIHNLHLAEQEKTRLHATLQQTTHYLHLAEQEKTRLHATLQQTTHNLHLADQEKTRLHATLQQTTHNLHLADQEKTRLHATLQQTTHNLHLADQEKTRLHATLQQTTHNLHLADQEKTRLHATLQQSVHNFHHSLHLADEKKALFHAKLLRQEACSSEELRQALAACEGRAHDVEKKGRNEEERRAECDRRMRRLSKANKQQEEKLRLMAEELQLQVGQTKEVEKHRVEEHRMEVQRLQSALDSSKEQARARERELCAEIIALKNNLLEEHSNRDKELEKCMTYEKELLETIELLRQEVKTHKDGRDLALDCLRKRRQDVEDVHRLLVADIRHCSGQGPGEKEKKFGLPLLERLHGVLEELKLRATNEVNADGLGRVDWAELLRRAGQWEKETERLVNVLESLCTWTSQKRRAVDTELLEVTLSAHTAELPQSLTLPAFCPLARPASATPPAPRRESVHGCSASEVNAESWLSVQRRLKTLQTVNFHNGIKELPRGVCA